MKKKKHKKTECTNASNCITANTYVLLCKCYCDYIYYFLCVNWALDRAFFYDHDQERQNDHHYNDHHYHHFRKNVCILLLLLLTISLTSPSKEGWQHYAVSWLKAHTRISIYHNGARIYEDETKVKKLEIKNTDKVILGKWNLNGSSSYLGNLKHLVATRSVSEYKIPTYMCKYFDESRNEINKNDNINAKKFRSFGRCWNNVTSLLLTFLSEIV